MSSRKPKSDQSTRDHKQSRDYKTFTDEKVKSLMELKPGDHIRVAGNKDQSKGRLISVSSTSSFRSHSTPTSRSMPSSDASCSEPERCDSKVYTHHLLVVEPIDGTHVKVINKVDEKPSILEEVKCYDPSDVTIMKYNCQYTGEEAIRRARERMEEGEEYNVVTSNCEHFVTGVRTGEEKCLQKEGVLYGGLGGVATGAVLGGSVGVLVGAGIGALIGFLIPPGGPVLGAGIGAAIGGGIGGVAGVAGGGTAGGLGGIAWVNKLTGKINMKKKRKRK